MYFTIQAVFNLLKKIKEMSELCRVWSEMFKICEFSNGYWLIRISYLKERAYRVNAVIP